MASIKDRTIPDWRERQILRPYILPLSVNTTSPNRNELRGQIARAGRVVPGTDGRKLGDSPFRAKLRKAVGNAAALGAGKYGRL